ncbi:hypothetical protein EVAR_23753_1 [Eumeta japonica]|uniref:Uncharacterized protein n=1 Tax=Eumeta variegata TaxID=151549 RepID=A0A4C1VII4_EUMVA|nr:hypothetical protein EVAR_23753_1 [Eumeta japonica]
MQLTSTPKSNKECTLGTFFHCNLYVGAASARLAVKKGITQFPNCNGDFSYRRVSPHPGLPLFTSARFSVVSGFLAVWRRSMMDSVFFQTSLFSRALQGDGWLATVSDAPLPAFYRWCIRCT